MGTAAARKSPRRNDWRTDDPMVVTAGFLASADLSPSAPVCDNRKTSGGLPNLPNLSGNPCKSNHLRTLVNTCHWCARRDSNAQPSDSKAGPCVIIWPGRKAYNSFSAKNEGFKWITSTTAPLRHLRGGSPDPPRAETALARAKTQFARQVAL
jgi:hypothetical protein